VRIAFFADAYHPRISGQVTSLDEFCKGLTKRGHEVRIVCPEYQAERMEGHIDLFPTIRVPSGTAIVSKDDRLGQPWRGYYALKKLKAFDPQVVHIQTEFSIGAMGRRYARRRGFPVLSTCHTHYEMYMKGYFPLLPEFMSRSGARTWLRNIYARDNVIIAPTRIIRDVMKSYGIESEYEVIPTGVDELTFQPRPAQAAAFRRSLAESEPGFNKGCLLVYVGRMGKEKNLDLLAKSMVSIVREAPDTHLLLVGDGPRREELQETFRSLGLSGNVAWRGFMDRDSLPAVYTAADIFVFPSKTEAQGLVTIEAMLCGTPVVGVNMMGSAEILEGDIGGLLADDDAEDFAAKTLALILDPALRAAKAAQAREHAENWTTGRSCDMMENLYKRLFTIQ